MTADLIRSKKERKESPCTEERLREHSETEVASLQLKDSEWPQEKANWETP